MNGQMTTKPFEPKRRVKTFKKTRRFHSGVVVSKWTIFDKNKQQRKQTNSSSVLVFKNGTTQKWDKKTSELTI